MSTTSTRLPAARPARPGRHRRPAHRRREGRRAPRSASCAPTASTPTSPTGSSAGEIADIRGLAKELGRARACSACTSRATAAPGCPRPSTAWPASSSRPSDSGIRSLVSVQGSLAMFAIWRLGSEEQKQRVAARAWRPARRSAASASPSPTPAPTRAACAPRARRDGGDWVLDGRKMWITNGSDRRRRRRLGADRRGRPRLRRADRHPRLLGPGDQAQAVAARLGHQRARARRRAAAGVEPCFPEVRGLRGPLSCLNEARYGIVWGAMGAARSSLEAALAYADERSAVRQADRRLPAHPAEARRHDPRVHQGRAARPAPRPPQGRRHAAPGAGQPRQAQQRPRGARDLPHRPHRSSAPTASRWSTPSSGT